MWAGFVCRNIGKQKTTLHFFRAFGGAEHGFLPNFLSDFSAVHFAEIITR
jgi:hypothetical protein